MATPDFTKLNADNIVDFIGGIFLRRGAESYLGEEVTMSQHMLQAARLAEEASSGDELTAAALLHDIGHYTNEFPEELLELGINNSHEDAGAAVLAPFFSAAITEAVRCHVDAKRYLCATDKDYLGKLSIASVKTLGLQGGPMNEDEVAEFRKHPHLDAIIKVRIWDDMGKVKDHTTQSFEHYAPMLQRSVDACRL